VLVVGIGMILIGAAAINVFVQDVLPPLEQQISLFGYILPATQTTIDQLPVQGTPEETIPPVAPDPEPVPVPYYVFPDGTTVYSQYDYDVYAAYYWGGQP
jgi:hypothetical protein